MECSEDVIKNLCSNDMNKFLKTMTTLTVTHKFRKDLAKVNNEVKKLCNGESIIHRALRYNTPATLEFLKQLAQTYPELLKEQRDLNDCKDYKGQSPLHVAIVKEYPKYVVQILKIAKKNKMTQDLLCITATGDKFKNTVLIGQLPLNVAALVCKNKNFEIIKILLKNHARIWQKNENGDTVLHSLIKYADDYPEKMEHIKPTFEFLCKKFSKVCESHKMKKRKKYVKVTDMLFWENSSGLTPLQLSAKLGVSELFQILIDIKDVYYFTDTKDGLFDIREYDVTEFDRLIGYIENSKNEGNLPILESLFDPRCSKHETMQILDIWVLEYVLQKKWKAYRIPLIVLMILHLLFMSEFTLSTIIKPQIFLCSETSERSCDISRTMYLVSGLDFVFGVIYLILAFLSMIKLRERFSCKFGCKEESKECCSCTCRCTCIKQLKKHCPSIFGDSCKFVLRRHNLDYIVCLFLIAIGALMESILLPLKIHWDYHLVFALISGWYFMLYFTPFLKDLASFTFMIRSGFLKHFFPYSIIFFVCFMVSFTSIMHMLFNGTENVEEFDNFGSSLLTMFNLGVGLNNIDVLNESRIPWLAYTVFIVFTIFSFINLFNALVAVMTNTFTDIHKNRKLYLSYSRLAMLELFEDIILVQILRKRPFKFLAKDAKYWSRSEDVEPSPIYKRYIKKYRQERESDLQEDNDNTDNGQIVGICTELKRKKRYYSLTQLLDDFEDLSDEKVEKKIKAKQFLDKNIRKSKRLKKVHPDRDVVLHVVHKSSQFPEDKISSK